MANLKDWIEDMAEGEPVQAVVLGEMGWGDWGSDDVPKYSEQPKGKVLTWDEALPWITYEFYDGFGGATSCNAIVAWTASWVISVSQDDGAPFPFRLPRSPAPVMPHMPGS